MLSKRLRRRRIASPSLSCLASRNSMHRPPRTHRTARRHLAAIYFLSGKECPQRSLHGFDLSQRIWQPPIPPLAALALKLRFGPDKKRRRNRRNHSFPFFRIGFATKPSHCAGYQKDSQHALRRCLLLEKGPLKPTCRPVFIPEGLKQLLEAQV